jgi:hypothetical protein
LRKRFDGASVDGDVEQVGRRWIVVIPQPVVHGLEVPHSFAGLGIQAQDAFGE